MKIWRPKDPRAVSLIKLTLWAGLVTWMVFTLTLSITLAQWVPARILEVMGIGLQGQVFAWIIPIWIVFTFLMLIWAVARFAVKKLRSKRLEGEEVEEEE